MRIYIEMVGIGGEGPVKMSPGIQDWNNFQGGLENKR